MSKKAFVFRLDWSPTDHEMYVVHAHSRAEAEAYAKRTGARYIHFYGEAQVREV